MRDYMGIHSPTLPAASQRDAPDNYFVRKRLVVIHQSRLYPQPIPVPTKSAGIDLEDLDRSPGELWEQLVARLEVADLPGFLGTVQLPFKAVGANRLACHSRAQSHQL